METTIKIEKLQSLQIGRQGENDSLTVNVDMTGWVEEHPDISLACFVLMQRPGENQAWPMTCTWNTTTNVLSWDISASATAIQGTGYAEIRAIDSRHDPEATAYSGIIKKSRVVPVLVDNSVSHVSGAAIAAPYQDFLNQVLAVKSELNDIFEAALTEYVIDPGYEEVPESGWSEEFPYLLDNKGEYLWTRTTFNWGTSGTSHIYTISYIPDDTQGDVSQVNGKGGNVVLDGRDINVDNSVQTPETLKAAVDRLTELAGANPVMNSAAVSSDAPASNDYLLAGKNDGSATNRVPVSSLFSPDGIHEMTGGYVAKKKTVTLTRVVSISATTFDTSRGDCVFRNGYYECECAFSYNDIPVTIDINYTNEGLIFAIPHFTKSLASGTGKLFIENDYFQLRNRSSFGDTLPSTLNAELIYLAAT